MREVVWELDSGEKTDQETGLRKLKEGSSEFLICTQEDGVFMQAYPVEDDVYHCEVVFPQGGDENALVYEAPSGVSADELENLFSRFAQGEDFSYVKQEWSRWNSPGMSRQLEKWVIRIAIVVIILVSISCLVGKI